MTGPSPYRAPGTRLRGPVDATHRTNTIIIGAGPSGLTVAALLTRAEVPHVLLDADRRVGDRWRRHYDRLHLHTTARFSALPGLRIASGHPTFVSRDQFADYLEQYAEHFGLAPRFGERAQSVTHDGAGWTVRTDSAMYLAHRVVVATGINRVPNAVTWPGLTTFPGQVIHSSAYRNGAPFRDTQVLVVGAGNSAAEIALCLHEHGARVTLSVRSALYAVPRRVGPLPVQLTTMLLDGLPDLIADTLSNRLADRTYAGLAARGVRRPGHSVYSACRTGRIPMLDVGTLALIRDGRIAVRPDVQTVAGRTVQFVDGRREPFDHMVLGTGYRAGLHDFLPDAAHVVDGRGVPRRNITEAEIAGLYFVGFESPPTGTLRAIGRQAERVAAQIIARGRRTRD